VENVVQTVGTRVNKANLKGWAQLSNTDRSPAQPLQPGVHFYKQEAGRGDAKAEA
jgi:hypothetical protein